MLWSPVSQFFCKEDAYIRFSWCQCVQTQASSNGKGALSYTAPKKTGSYWVVRFGKYTLTYGISAFAHHISYGAYRFSQARIVWPRSRLKALLANTGKHSPGTKLCRHRVLKYLYSKAPHVNKDHEHLVLWPHHDYVLLYLWFIILYIHCIVKFC